MRIDNPTHIDMRALASERPDRRLIVQFSDPSAYDPLILNQVDIACTVFGSRLDVRFYGHLNTEFDCSVLKFLPSAQSLLLDCLTAIKNLEYISDLDQLVSFGFGAFESKSPGFLRFPNMAKLQRLVLGDTRKHDIDLAPLADFAALRELTVVGHHKNIDVLAASHRIEALSLVSIPRTVNLAFVPTMAALKRLSISFGGRETMDEVQHRTVESLELLAIRGLRYINPAAFPSLTNLEIEDQAQLAAIDLGMLTKLRRLRIINCKTLAALPGIESLRQLNELRLGRTCIDPDELLARSLPKQIMALHLWGYGAKRDKQLDATLKSMGFYG